MYFKNLLPSLYLRFWYIYNLVETSRPQQCSINHINSISCSEDNDFMNLLYAVHLNQADDDTIEIQ